MKKTIITLAFLSFSPSVFAAGYGLCNDDGYSVSCPYYFVDLAGCNEQLAVTLSNPGNVGWWCSSLDDAGNPINPYVPPLPPPGAPPAYGDSPFGALPPINPIEDGLVGAAAAVGLGLLAGIGALVGAPVLAAVSGAAALVAGVMTAAGIAMNSPSTATAQGFVDAVKPPLSVKLAPVSESPPAPVLGATSSPSVVTDPVSGKFVPGGGSLSDGYGVTGGWSGGASGEWSYTPPATPSNPTPAPIVQISDSGYGLKQQTAPVAGGTSSGGVYVQRFADGSVVVTNSAEVPVTTSSGAPTTIGASVSTSFNSSGALNPGSSAAAVAPVLGNGSDSGAGAGLSVSGFGGGTTSNIGSGAPGPAGGCASGDCATESTQLANKGLLQSLKDFLTGTALTPGDPTARTGADIKGASLDGSSAFTGLRGWQLPAHVSQCPTSSFNWNGNTYTFEAHCQLAQDHFTMFHGVMTLIFSLSALFIVLRA